MIDIATTLFSTLMALYIIVRAARMDRTLPWFETRREYERSVAQQETVAVIKRRGRGAVEAAQSPAGRPGMRR